MTQVSHKDTFRIQDLDYDIPNRNGQQKRIKEPASCGRKKLLYVEVWRVSLLKRPIINPGSGIMQYGRNVIKQYKLKNPITFYV